MKKKVRKIRTQFLKFNNLFWFLGKNISNFVPPIWKLHDPYCHIDGTQKTYYEDPDSITDQKGLVQFQQW